MHLNLHLDRRYLGLSLNAVNELVDVLLELYKNTTEQQRPVSALCAHDP